MAGYMDPQQSIDNQFGKGVWSSLQTMKASGNPTLISRANQLEQIGLGTQSAMDATRSNAQPSTPAQYGSLTDALNGAVQEGITNAARYGGGVLSGPAGTFRADQVGALAQHGLAPWQQQQVAPPQNNTAQMDRFRDSAMQYISNMQNPYAADAKGRDNLGLQALKSQVSGQTGDVLGRALSDQREANALNGIRSDSGLAQNQNMLARLAAGQQKSQQLTGLDAANYDKAAEFGKWKENLAGQMEQAANSYDLNRFSALQNAYQQQYENARQQPFDALKLAGMRQDLSFNDQYNPLRLQQANADYLGTMGRNAYQGLQNDAAGMSNDAYRQLMPDTIASQKSGLQYDTRNNEIGLNQLNDQADFYNKNKGLFDYQRQRGITDTLQNQSANDAVGFLIPGTRFLSTPNGKAAFEIGTTLMGAPGLGGMSPSSSQSGYAMGRPLLSGSAMGNPLSAGYTAPPIYSGMAGVPSHKGYMNY